MAYQLAGEASWFLDSWAHGRILRVQWVATSGGAVEAYCPFEVAGELHELVSRHADSARTGTYTIYLYDRLNRDILNSLGVTLPVNATTPKSLHQVITASVQSRASFPLAGPLRLVMSNSDGAATWGAFDLYLREGGRGNRIPV